MQSEIDKMIWEPITRFMSAGNETQLCGSKYKGVNITWRIYFPWNIFKDPKNWFELDLILPMKTGPFMDDRFYTEEGFGCPIFDTIEEAVAFIDEHQEKNKIVY